MFELRPNRLPSAPFFFLAAALLAGACDNPEAQAPSAASFAEAMAGLDTVELIGHVEILGSDAFPQWYEGTEFKAARDAMITQAGS